MKKVLVLCTGNSCRSQIAEAYLRHFAGDKAEIFSAGVETHGVNPRAIAIMKEDGIDISKHRSKNIDEYFRLCNNSVRQRQRKLSVLSDQSQKNVSSKLS
jgi:arsenate reductase